MTLIFQPHPTPQALFLNFEFLYQKTAKFYHFFSTNQNVAWRIRTASALWLHFSEWNWKESIAISNSFLAIHFHKAQNPIDKNKNFMADIWLLKSNSFSFEHEVINNFKGFFLLNRNLDRWHGYLQKAPGPAQLMMIFTFALFRYLNLLRLLLHLHD